MNGHRAVGIDLGKTRCRLVLVEGSAHTAVDGAGSPGLAAVGGVEAALAAVLPLLDRVGGDLTNVGIGAAGAWTAPDAAQQLAGAVSARTGAHVAVTSDVVTAHAGALIGEPGVLLIAGTGAAALGVDADGVRLVDGWGPDLGDLGGGSWLGREGLRAVLRAEHGLEDATALTAAAAAHTAPESSVPAWLSSAASSAQRLATFAPLVLDAAADGDPVARTIAAEAARLLSASAVAARGASHSVVVHGGLTGHAWFLTTLEGALRAARADLVAARGSALDGALLLAAHNDLPHERYVHRAG